MRWAGLVAVFVGGLVNGYGHGFIGISVAIVGALVWIGWPR